MKDALAKCSLLAAHGHRSTRSENLINETCDFLKLEYRKTVLPCKTRWNSELYSMKSLLYLRAALKIEAAKDSKFEKLLLSPLEFTVLEACIPILEQFDLFSKLKSKQKEQTLHQIIPSSFRIHTMITNIINSNQGCKELAFISSTSSPTFDEEEDPVFHVIKSYTRTNPNSSVANRQIRHEN